MSSPEIQVHAPITPGQTQYLRYRNSYISGRCNGAECVLILSPSFAHTVSAKIWDERLMFSRPQEAVLLSGEEALVAERFLQRVRAVPGHSAPSHSSPQPSASGEVGVELSLPPSSPRP